MKSENLPAIPESYRAAATIPPTILDADYEPQAAHVPLAHYLWILRRHAWKIAGGVLATTLATLIVSLRLAPIYESTATIDIDRRMPTGVLGQEASEIVNNDADQFLATQVKLIQSDSVMRPVVDKFHLREVEKDALEEAIDTSALSLEAPVILKRLQVTRPPNTYILQISYRSPNRQLAADVANEIAVSYLAHTYRIRYKATAGLSEFMERQLEELKAQMEKSSEALAKYERDLSVINPEEKTNILSARLLELNTEYTKAQAERVAKEAAYNAVKGGSLESAEASSQGDALKKLTESQNQEQQKFAEMKKHLGVNHPEYQKQQALIDEIQQQIQSTRASIAARVESEYREAADSEAMLEQKVKETKTDWDDLNSRSFNYQSLKREADSDKQLYEELVRKIKEAGINAGFQNSSIRIADEARPGLKPVFPRTWLNVLLAFLTAAFIGVSVAVLSDVLDNTIRDPDQVMRLMNTDVIGSLPAVKDWRRHLSPIQSIGALKAAQVASHPNGNGNGNGPSHRKQAKLQPLPAAGAQDQALSNYEEAIRTLRNSILLTDFDRRLRSVLLTSASPSEGKSTVAAHLAATHASQHKRTLLIDGDLRRTPPVSGAQQRGVIERTVAADLLARRGHPDGRSGGPGRPAGRTFHAAGIRPGRHGPGGID
jgi:uncharacterized protein involved in exopolysaccharide biosynthesis